ncbi:hypothetical protein F183_A11820 [Bryobacterales bacterium F-183]|nr:hypothetical protein F183_A11820 [Bryobacterales bacterium F-183]
MLLLAAASTVMADNISYTYETTLKKYPGSVDGEGLDGARITVNATVNDSAVYQDFFGMPGVRMNNGATLTVSGASVAANNGTFVMPKLIFLPGFSGLFTLFGATPLVMLGSGGMFDMRTNSFPTAEGALAVVGDTVSLDHFAPAVSRDIVMFSSDTTFYASDTSISAVLVAGPDPAAVPEPAVYGLLAVAAGLPMLARRRRVLSRR